jgi:hypothetical protein
MMNVSHDHTEIFFDEIDIVVVPPSFYSIEEGWLIVFDKLERVFYPFNTSQYQVVQVFIHLIYSMSILQPMV